MKEEPRRILLVAEDPARLAPLIRILDRTPHQQRVLGPEEACRSLEQGEQADLLIVAIEAPAMAGFDVIRCYHRILGQEQPALAVSDAFKREHIEGMLENTGVRRLFRSSIPAEELLFWVNYALYPEAMRSRRAPRVPVSFVLSIARRKRLLRGRAFNLSEDGLFLETARAGGVGEIVELRFRIPTARHRGETIVARCEIVWANPKPQRGGGGEGPFGIGLRFLDLDEDGRRAIKSYVLNGLLEQAI